MDIKNGRLRFTGESNTTSHYPAGIEFTNQIGTAVTTFWGMYNDNVMGFYGYGGGNWGSLLLDGTTGNAGVGALPSATSKLLVEGGSGTAVELSGALKVSGSYPTAFVVTASAGNLIDYYTPPVNYTHTQYYYTLLIDNALCNGDPNAMLFVTAQKYPGSAMPISVWYDNTSSKWKIGVNPDQTYRVSCYGLASASGSQCGSVSYWAVLPYQPGEISDGDKFNVLVIKQ